MSIHLLIRALDYGQRGWKIFPLHTPAGGKCSCTDVNCNRIGKHSRIKEWTKNCSSDLVKIESWWKQWPDANIGIATGIGSGFFILDVDPRFGGDQTLNFLLERDRELPSTLRSNTGNGGHHLLFKTRKMKIENRNGLYMGVDVRGEGGYMVAPPSMHVSGEQYVWDDGFDPCLVNDPPEWLAATLSKCKDPNSEVKEPLCDLKRINSQPKEFAQSVSGPKEKYAPRRKSPVSKLDGDGGIFPSQINSLMGIDGSEPNATTWPDIASDQAVSMENVPSFSSALIPEPLKPWVMDISERMQINPASIASAALVSLSWLISSKIGVCPKRRDEWMIVPNLWGALVSQSRYLDGQAIVEALKPLQAIYSQSAANAKNEEISNSSNMLKNAQYIRLKNVVRGALKTDDYEKLESLNDQLAKLRGKKAFDGLSGKKYPADPKSFLKNAPDGWLFIEDDLCGWLTHIAKPKHQRVRDFLHRGWNGYDGYFMDHFPHSSPALRLTLSIFGSTNPRFVAQYLENAKDDDDRKSRLFEHFQILVCSPHPKTWRNIDRIPDHEAKESVFALFKKLAGVPSMQCGLVPSVRFSSEAQEEFDVWLAALENKVRSNAGSPWLSHLSGYRSLLPSLALIFWILEQPENIHGCGAISVSATRLAIEWCDLLKRHAAIIYDANQLGENQEAKTTVSSTTLNEERGEDRFGDNLEKPEKQRLSHLIREKAAHKSRAAKSDRRQGNLFKSDQKEKIVDT
jgi:putative DNA primase/helicase